MSYTQVSAEEMKKFIGTPMSREDADALGLLGVGMRGGPAKASSPAPMLHQIYDRIAVKNDQFRELIERLEGAMDRIQPLDVSCSPADNAPGSAGIIGCIEAAVDYQGELLSRLGRIAAHLETIA